MNEKIVRISNLNGVVKYILPTDKNLDAEKFRDEINKYDGTLYRLISVDGFKVVMRVIVSQLDKSWERFHDMLHELSGTKEIYRVPIAVAKL